MEAKTFEETFINLKSKLHKLTAYPLADIHIQTRVVEDLSLVGDDAYELIKMLEDDYSVNFVGFSFPKYFPSEGGCNPLSAIISLIMGKNLNESPRDMSVGHLVSVIQAKRWFDPK